MPVQLCNSSSCHIWDVLQIYYLKEKGDLRFSRCIFVSDTSSLNFVQKCSKVLRTKVSCKKFGLSGTKYVFGAFHFAESFNWTKCSHVGSHFWGSFSFQDSNPIQKVILVPRQPCLPSNYELTRIDLQVDWKQKIAFGLPFKILRFAQERAPK